MWDATPETQLNSASAVSKWFNGRGKPEKAARIATARKFLEIDQAGAGTEQGSGLVF